MERTVGLLLAGGVGSRLGVLAQSRAKPAVPFGGNYRIIDFTLSNAANSGVHMLGVLTQYKPGSLMEHIGNGESWGYGGRTRVAKILPPHTGEDDSDWYRGTADAVRQNLRFVYEHASCDSVLVLSGDHIYKMDYSKMLAQHRECGADLTIATMRVPMEDASQFGIASVDGSGRITEWEEKPAVPSSNLASMGIYVFSLRFLETVLAMQRGHDFGKHIVPYAVRHAKTWAYMFDGYWRDVGTLPALWRANMDLLDPQSGLDLERWQTYTHISERLRAGDRPPSYIGSTAKVHNSVISQGCVIEGEVYNSVLSPGCWIQGGAVVRDSVLMNNCEIGEHAEIRMALFDKNVVAQDHAIIGGQKADGLEQLTVVGKGASLPMHCEVGGSCTIGTGVQPEDFHDLLIAEGTTVP